jgi:hypothetical protein
MMPVVRDQRTLVNGMPLVCLPMYLDAQFPRPITVVKRPNCKLVKLLFWNIWYCINTEALNIILAPLLFKKY